MLRHNCLSSLAVIYFLVSSAACVHADTLPTTAREAAVGTDARYVSDSPIPVFGHKCAEVLVIRAQLSQYGQVAMANYTPPTTCPAGWSQVILHLDGGVRGVQFDRFGAVWLSGVEILRTTTPEPSPQGITWQVLRDITAVSPVLRRPGNMSVHIPNVVDGTYTGVLFVNVSLSFFHLPGQQKSSDLSAYVRPLINWTQPNIFKTGVNGNQAQVNLVSGLPRNMARARLELFASGHGDEEFWYTNLPSQGGVAYRELEVYVDGIAAGVAYPFPVIYTGGVNPLLWRPLTGIASFDVPPYSFDLSPFVGLLNDGRTHNISVSVQNNNEKGVWYLDGVFYADLEPAVDVLAGVLLRHTDSGPVVNVNRSCNGGLACAITSGHREVKVTGALINRQSSTTTVFSSDYVLHAFNNNTEVTNSIEVTSGWMHSKVTSEHWDADALNAKPTAVVSEAWFPYYVYDESTQDATTFEIGPTSVNYSRAVNISVYEDGEAAYALQIFSSIDATALYNRTLVSRVVNKANGTSEALSILQAGVLPASPLKSCFFGRLTAANGLTVTNRTQPETCHWHDAPWGLYACGLSFCSHLDRMGYDATGLLQARGVSLGLRTDIDAEMTGLMFRRSRQFSDPRSEEITFV
eukprot:TRINITY_DN8074_c0_g1_i2.p1 TRINITY_DN8074_c0_g1~~TRINITY_DN8074_c0_g1_i2.p1  ORF type:complete len:634 (-),score=47.80 TRINITY_DN8074_c0_g1_i2:120-2021(-)